MPYFLIPSFLNKLPTLFRSFRATILEFASNGASRIFFKLSQDWFSISVGKFEFRTVQMNSSSPRSNENFLASTSYSPRTTPWRAISISSFPIFFFQINRYTVQRTLPFSILKIRELYKLGLVGWTFFWTMWEARSATPKCMVACS